MMQHFTVLDVAKPFPFLTKRNLEPNSRHTHNPKDTPQDMGASHLGHFRSIWLAF